VTSVAYSDRPERPRWLDVTVALVAGWLGAGIALLGLYGAAWGAGAISQPYGSLSDGINEWPYAGNGAWSVLADIAVLAIALALTTAATSWVLRRKYALVSDGRLAVALFFAGWLPLTFHPGTGEHAGGRGLFGFLLALVLVRYWVVGRYDGRLRPVTAACLVAAFGAVVVSYGVLHPLWTAGVFPITATGKHQSVLVDVHNAARVGVTIDHIDASDVGPAGAQPARLHLAPGGHGLIAVRVYQGCGSGVVDLRARYHVFGVALSEVLPVRIQLHSWDGGC
jgi:hypothetical protein